jgi:hypothetical protein
MMPLNGPLLPYCGCITDNLGGGLCTSCWETAIADGGACFQLIQDCGPACTAMLNDLPTECGMAATPACLETIAQTFPSQVDDFAAVLTCLCNCSFCDNAACP